MPESSLVSSFLCALQASLSALIVIAAGVVACEFKLLDGPSGKKISSLCVHMLLPALLITQVGRQLNADTASRYVPILGKHTLCITFCYLRTANGWGSFIGRPGVYRSRAVT